MEISWKINNLWLIKKIAQVAWSWCLFADSKLDLSISFYNLNLFIPIILILFLAEFRFAVAYAHAHDTATNSIIRKSRWLAAKRNTKERMARGRERSKLRRNHRPVAIAWSKQHDLLRGQADELPQFRGVLVNRSESVKHRWASWGELTFLDK